ncbi:MAG TPA: glycosyltransferase family 39 protein [Fimbriiglobus sp.]|jgi:hypothetical protein
MEVAVGARLETVVPRRTVRGGDVIRLLVLVGLAVVVHVWLIAHTIVPARDTIGFARQAVGLGRPATFLDTVRNPENKQHPGYPLTVIAAFAVVREVYDASRPEQMLRSAQVASSVAGILLVMPMYLLGRMLFGRFAGFAGAALFQVLPVPAHLTADGLTEALYLLCAVSAVGCGVVGLRKQSTAFLLAAGLCTGLAYLVRPEGLLLAFGVFLTAGLLVVRRTWPARLAVARLTAFTVGVALAAAPYMALIGGFTTKPGANEILEKIKGNPRQQLYQGQVSRLGGETALFATWFTGNDGTKEIWSGKAVAQEVTKGFYYVPAFLAAVGLFLFRRRAVADPGLGLVLALMGLNIGVLFLLAYNNGYVSERHTMLIVALGTVVAAGTLEPIGRLWAWVPGAEKFAGLPAAGVGLIVLVAAALPATFRPLHDNRAGHFYAGRYLGSVVTDADAVFDPFCWAEYYAGRTYDHIPPDPPGAKVSYAILETGPSPHSRLPRLEHAKIIAAAGKVVYYWPENGTVEQAKVLVYKTVR